MITEVSPTKRRESEAARHGKKKNRPGEKRKTKKRPFQYVFFLEDLPWSPQSLELSSSVLERCHGSMGGRLAAGVCPSDSLRDSDKVRLRGRARSASEKGGCCM